MSIIIFYGIQNGWIVNANKILDIMKPYILDCRHYTDISELKNYLNEEGKNYKNYIFPLTEHPMIELEKHNIKAIMPNLSIIYCFSNKDSFDKYIISNNLQSFIPKRYYFNDYSENIVIVKPNCGGNSEGMYLSKVKDLDSSIFKTHVVQEYIKSEVEYTGNLVVDNGKIIYSFAYYRDYGDRNYIKHDNEDQTVQITTGISPNFEKQIESMLLPVKYSGPCNVDFKIVDDRVVVFEINPRFGGSLFFENHLEDLARMIFHSMNINI